MSGAVLHGGPLAMDQKNLNRSGKPPLGQKPLSEPLHPYTRNKYWKVPSPPVSQSHVEEHWDIAQSQDNLSGD